MTNKYGVVPYSTRSIFDAVYGWYVKSKHPHGSIQGSCVYRGGDGSIRCPAGVLIDPAEYCPSFEWHSITDLYEGGHLSARLTHQLSNSIEFLQELQEAHDKIPTALPEEEKSDMWRKYLCEIGVEKGFLPPLAPATTVDPSSPTPPSRFYERADQDYIDRTIATVRQHIDADNCWPQWANIFATEIEALRVELAEAKNAAAEPAKQASLGALYVARIAQIEKEINDLLRRTEEIKALVKRNMPDNEPTNESKEGA
jgi:hypothetical protein